MVKVVLLLLINISIFAQVNSLEKNCLDCHNRQQIPNNLIYKRYLLKYSTEKNMQKKIFNYLKNPQITTSIMPSQFFLKFPMKDASSLEREQLNMDIKAFLKMFNLKKKLRLNNSY